MILVGLTGGVATGKTTVAKMFEACGAILIDADRLAREVVEPGKPAWRDIVQQFGPAVLNPDRSLNRATLAATIFRHPGKRRRLERIIHPRVARRQRSCARAIAKHKPRAVIVYEVPLLFEAHVDRRVDYIVVVAAGRTTQIGRLKRRNGLTRTEALRRITSQMSMPQKIARADMVLDGASPRRLLRKQVMQLYQTLAELA